MKKSLAFILALIMLLSLCACGPKDSADPTEGTGKPSAPTEPTPTDPPADPTDPDKEPAEDKVTVAVLKEMVRSGSAAEGDYEVLRMVPEYDENYKLIGKKAYLNDALYYDISFDRDVNKPLISKDYFADGTLSGSSTYTYDDAGNLLCYSSTYSYDGETITNSRVCTYDEKGNMLTERNYTNDVLDYESLYTYTADGLLESDTTYWYYGVSDPSSVQPAVTKYTYDEHGNLLSQHMGGPISGSNYTYENTYDKDGNLVEVKGYDCGNLYNRVCYDADGNETLWVGYNTDDGKEWRCIETAYDNGRLISKVSYSDGELDSTDLYTYNAKGQRIKHSYSSANGRRYYYTYEYNELGEVTLVNYYEDDVLTTQITLTYEIVTVSRQVAEGLQAVYDEYDLQ